MRIVLQRVTDAKVTVNDTVVGETGTGLLALVGFGKTIQPTLRPRPSGKR